MNDSGTPHSPVDENKSPAADPESPPEYLDLNNASVEELTAISGIGPVLAERIIAQRPFASVDALREVQGINETNLAGIRPFVFVQPPADPAVAEAAQEPPEPPPLDEPAQLPAAEIVAAGPEQPDAADRQESPEIETTQTGDELSAEDLPVENYPRELFAAQATARPADEEQAPEPVEAASRAPAAGQAESRPAAPPPPVGTVPTTAERPTGISGCSVAWLAVATGLVAVILGVAITLGLLGAINGGLRYSRPADLSAVESEFQMLQAEASTLSDEVEALRQRMDNLEALSGRVSQVEEITGNLQAELEATGQELETANQQLAALSGEMETLSGEIQSLKAEVAALQDSTTRFEDFLGGLGQLLRRVGIPLPGGEPAPGGDNP